MYKDQTSVRRDFLSLAKFAADVSAARPQAWKSVERLKLACALEAVWTPTPRCGLDDPSLAYFPGPEAGIQPALAAAR